MKVLIVEDNEEIAEQLKTHLKASGFVVQCEHDGESGYFEGREGSFDGILLDVGLPGMDGISVLEKWREDGVTTPVVIITARDSKVDIIRGLESGADDYVTKPFDLDEVVARLRSNIKRETGKTSSTIKAGNVVLDTKAGRVLKDGVHVKLTRIEYLMVQYLFMNQGRPVSINELTEHTYEDFDNDSGIIPRHIANIRKKLGSEVILTEANRGYYVPEDSGS